MDAESEQAGKLRSESEHEMSGETPEPAPVAVRVGWRVVRSIGPALIVASVVLGPGSILAASRLGADHGHALNWLLAASSLLMMGMVMLGARLGIALPRTPCAELAARLGRPVAAGIGLIVFLIVTCFQVGNNTAVLAVLRVPTAAGSDGASGLGRTIAGLLALNGLAVASLFGFRNLYALVERLLSLLVLLMIVGFAGNLLLARPDLIAALKGLLPQWPEALRSGFLPLRDGATVRDPLGAAPALVATTMSVAGAFYYAYLVKEKDWNRERLREGMVDTLTGIAVLGGVTGMILMTAATVFHGQSDATPLRTTTDLARQLEPMFGPFASTLFNVGLFAAAFSSFLVNALIGGSVMADALGLEAQMGSRPVRWLTVLGLGSSMALAVGFTAAGASSVGIILLAQALTVLGLPALALAMIYLATRPEVQRAGLVPRWLLGIAVACAGVSIILALRKAWELCLRLAG